MAVSCMRNASSRNYSNDSFIVDVAMEHIPRSTERFAVDIILKFQLDWLHDLGG